MYINRCPSVTIAKTGNFEISTFGLKGSSLGFEHHKGRLRIREVKEEGDFKDILRHIRFLVDGDKSEDDVFHKVIHLLFIHNTNKNVDIKISAHDAFLE
jgi:hypothetical protein